jgi:pilus assembly protein CpaC
MASLALQLSLGLWPAKAQSTRWQSEGDRVRQVAVTLYKSRTFRLDQPFTTAVVG